MSREEHDEGGGFVLSSECSTIDCLRMQWTCERSSSLTSKTTIMVNQQPYIFDGFYLLSHRVFSRPPPFEYLRENVKCTFTFTREPLPPQLDEPNVRLRVSGFQDYIFWQLMRIPPHLIFPNLAKTGECAPFHLYPRFVMTNSIQIQDMTRFGFADGTLLPIDTIMDYLDASAMSTPEMFLADFPPEALLHHVVSSEDSASHLGCFRIDIVTPQRKLIHDGQGASGQNGINDSKRSIKWREVAPLERLPIDLPSAMKILHPTSCFLTGLKCDVFELVSALPLVFRFLHHCADLDQFEARWHLNFQDKALLRQAFTHISYVDCGIHHINIPEAVLARVQMGYHFSTEGKGESPPDTANSLSSITKEHIDSDFKPHSYSRNLCPYERLEFLGDAVLSFLVSSNIFFKFPDVSEGQLHELRSNIITNSTIGDLAKTCQIDRLILSAFQLEKLDEQMSIKISADVVEALLGAIFYEQGWNQGVASSSAFLRQLIVVFDQELADFMFLLSQDLNEKVFHSLNHDMEAFQKHPKAIELMKLHEEFQKNCSIPIQRPHIWLQAMTHKSFKGNAISPDDFVLGRDGNYERLEFLGDSILQVITSKVLMDSLPNHQEDLLSSVRSAIVNNNRLASVGEKLQYARYIRFGENVVSNGLNLRSVVADTFEACLAAMYLEQLNLETIEQFLQGCLFLHIPEAICNREWMGPKQRFLTLVKHWPQSSKIDVSFDVLECKQPNMHSIALSIDGYLVCRAMAPTKEMAADKAATKALQLFGL